MLAFRGCLASGTLRATVLSMIATLTAAQTSWPPGGGGVGGADPEPRGLFKAWVDPVAGVDSSAPQNQINDPDAPFKTLQKAINAVHTRLVQEYPSFTGILPLEGIVFALPGLYGAHGAGSSGDTFPIELMDRVHVQGLGARRAIIRGIGSGSTQVTFPTGPTAAGSTTIPDAEVLVSLEKVHKWYSDSGNYSPWVTGLPGEEPDLIEVLDGFTFQGGDVQVLARYNTASVGIPQESNAIISNCVFDMRNGWPIANVPGSSVPGPYFGIMMSKALYQNSNDVYGYIDQKLLITNNTFIMAQWGPIGTSEGWVYLSRDEAVGIIDQSVTSCQSTTIDCDQRVRGLGNPAIINNVFRTAPASGTPAPAAMLGISKDDTRIYLSSPAAVVDANAFAPARVGDPMGSNGAFFSLAMNSVMIDPEDPSQKIPALWYCQPVSGITTSNCNVFDPGCPADTCVPSSLPSPIVALWDGGASGVDPGFVGEFLSVTVSGLAGYTDWRLLPGRASANASPLKDVGFLPSTPLVVMQNGTAIALPERDSLSPFDWDGEHYGNPRVVDNAIDIGFDEIHLMVMAGSYGNDSSSHNQPGSLNPLAPTGAPDRYALLRNQAGGVTLAVGNQVKVHGVLQSPASPPPAWSIPPGVLPEPIESTSLPEDYRTKYINFSVTAVTPFNEVLTQSNFVQFKPLNQSTTQATIDFVLGSAISDDEGSQQDYFSTQAVVKTDGSPSGSILLRSNMQAEYR